VSSAPFSSIYKNNFVYLKAANKIYEWIEGGHYIWQQLWKVQGHWCNPDSLKTKKILNVSKKVRRNFVLTVVGLTEWSYNICNPDSLKTKKILNVSKKVRRNSDASSQKALETSFITLGSQLIQIIPKLCSHSSSSISRE
jgi:hypothetical protein